MKLYSVWIDNGEQWGDDNAECFNPQHVIRAHDVSGAAVLAAEELALPYDDKAKLIIRDDAGRYSRSVNSSGWWFSTKGLLDITVERLTYRYSQLGWEVRSGYNDDGACLVFALPVEEAKPA